MKPFDAIVIVSFGGPEGPDDVLPFLENVTRGRNIPRQRLEVVAEQYRLFGGVSPINAINRRLLARLNDKLARSGPALRVYWGNRNWAPLLTDTVRTMAADGVGHALAFVTSAYSSYSSCRQYLDNLAAACREVGPGAPVIEKIRPYWNHPRFVDMFVASARAALNATDGDAHFLFSAHSIPSTMAATCDYAAQLREAARLIATELGLGQWDVVFQSRSGPPTQPWLEPDINDQLRVLAARGVRRVVTVPIGFVADHMEVLYDLDTQAAATARELGMSFLRVPTPGDTADFVELIHDLLMERLENRPPAVVGQLAPCPSPCPVDCCRYDAHRPAIARDES